MKRLYTIDAIRGIAVIAMIVFHTLWDICYIFHVNIPEYTSRLEDPFGMDIGITFIFISGFSFGLGKKRIRRALKVLGSALALTLVTMVIMPSCPIYFGVLSLIGSMMLFMLPLSVILKKLNPYATFVLLITLFIAAFNIPHGYIGIQGFEFYLPSAIYSSIGTAYFGFPPISFASADYYPILPWCFMYMAGYSAYLTLKKHSRLDILSKIRIPPLEWIGRKALPIYLLHQPVIYGVLAIVFSVI